MTYKAVRKFNGATDPYWSTPEGTAELGGYATFDHHMGDEEAARKFIEESKGVAKSLGKEGEHEEALAALDRAKFSNSREVSFVFNQDVFELSEAKSPEDLKEGVRNFHDPRLEVSFRDGKIVRSDGKVRRGWRWV